MIDDFRKPYKKTEYEEDKKEITPNQEEKKYNVIWSVLFTSLDNSINFPISCYSDEKFSSLLERFYIKNPDYRKPTNYFICNASQIDINKTMEENGINDNSIIMIFN